MRIFVYEYSCCRPAAEGTTAAALRAEGWAMLSAVVHDLARVPGVVALTLLAEDLGPVPFACRRLASAGEELAFRELAAGADFTLVIAPEIDGILHARCGWVIEAGGRLLGPSPEAVRLAADKLALAGHLRARGVPTPPTRTLQQAIESPGRVGFPAVCKPRHGAGSQATYLVRGADGLRRIADTHPEGDLIAQPYVPGQAASVALLLGPLRRLSLPPAVQHLSADGRFHYLGGAAPLPPPLAERARRVAEAAIDALPGLCGYVGVDVVLGTDPGGGGDQVIEINPRLTTSYVGLRALAETNLAETMLRLACGEDTPEPCWYEGTVTWTPDGRTSFRPGGGPKGSIMSRDRAREG